MIMCGHSMVEVGRENQQLASFSFSPFIWVQHRKQTRMRVFGSLRLCSINCRVSENQSENHQSGLFRKRLFSQELISTNAFFPSKYRKI